MQDLINTLQEPQNAIVLLSVLLVLVVIATLIIRFKRKEIEYQEKLEEARKRAEEEDAAARGPDENQRFQKMQEATQSQLNMLNDSMMRSISEMGRTLQGQMDSFHTQVNTLNLQEEQRMDAMRRMVDERMKSYDDRMQDISRNLDGKLGSMQRTVGEDLTQNIDRRINESFKMVSERLEKVYQGLGEMQNLAEGVGDLKKVLTNVKVRGIWGEAQLGALLEQMLAPSQYVQNAALNPQSDERVEYAVRMPGIGDDPVYLPIDAKFPQADYERLLDAAESGDAVAAETAGRQLENVILAEARKMRDKYICPPHTTDFAMMFLPVEGLYAEVLRREGIQEKLQNEYHVVIAGPTTLAALLNSLQMGFRSLAIEQRSSEVWHLLGEVKTEFQRFADALDDTQKKVQRAGTALDSMSRRTRIMSKKLSDVQEIALDEGAAVPFLADAPDEQEQP